MVSKSLDQIARVPCTFSSSKVAEGGDAGFQVTDEIFPSWRGSLKKICEGSAKDRQDEFTLRYTRRLQDENRSRRDALCRRGEYMPQAMLHIQFWSATTIF